MTTQKAWVKNASTDLRFREWH